MNANVSVAALAAGNVDYNLILQSVVTANLRGLPLKIAGILIVLESDGGLLLSLFNLPTLANLDPKNLNVFVFDNQVYSGTRISEPTATAGKTDLAMMARGAGIEHAVTVASLPEFQAEMEAGLTAKGSNSWSAKSKRVCAIARSCGPTWIRWKTNTSLFDTSNAPKAGPFFAAGDEHKSLQRKNDVCSRGKTRRRIRERALPESGGALARAGHGFSVHATTESRHTAA